MLLVIFGAGASYDSVPHRLPPSSFNEVDFAAEYRPPLADGLFADRPLFVDAMTRFRACRPIIPRLQTRPDKATVEQVLEGFQREAVSNPRRAQQLRAVQFYLHYMLWDLKQHWDAVTHGITNYLVLLDRIEGHRLKGEAREVSIPSYDSVCLVTFNYDTLLEDALDTVNLRLGSMSDYIARPDYKLIKVHGSVNWARVVTSRVKDVDRRNVMDIADELIERAAELEIDQTYHLVADHPVGKLAGGYALVPAVAIPVETKRAFECPEEHLDALRACIAKTTKVLIVGWRGSERHFVDLLWSLPRNAQGMIVAGSRNAASEVETKLQHLPVAWHKAEGGFSHFVTSVEADAFLRS